jgi:hypothetical protein
MAHAPNPTSETLNFVRPNLRNLMLIVNARPTEAPARIRVKMEAGMRASRLLA